MKLNWMLIVLPIILVLFKLCHSSSVRINIGAIFEDSTFYNDDIQMLQYATAEANEKILQYGGMRLGFEAKTIEYGREFTVSKRVCDLLELGVGVVIGPESVTSANHTMNLCDIMELPYINTFLDEDAASKLSVLNVYPNLESLTQLVIDYVNASNWRQATILYESSLWLRRAATILETNNLLKNRISVHDLDYTTNNDFRQILQVVRDSNDTNIILDCSIESLPIILRQSMEVGLMTKYYSWVIANLDAHSIDLEPYSYSGVNITLFRILNINYPIFDLIKTSSGDSDDDDDAFNVDPATRKIAGSKNCDATNENSNTAPFPVYPQKFKYLISLRAALIYDAVMVFAYAIGELGREQVLPTKILCDDPTTSWNKGNTILNFMKKVKYDGLTGWIEFDNLSLRSNITVELLELGKIDLQPAGTWKHGFGNWTNRLTINRVGLESNIDESNTSLKGKSLQILTAVAKPYTMLKEETESLEGDDRLEGFAVDLIRELSLLLEFNYTFIVEEDAEYGKELGDGTWNGMIGKLMREEADIAITDLTVTLERIKAIDFTPSILDLGIAILYQIPKKREASTFSFMAPFSNDVWRWLVFAYVIVSLCFFCLGRICPSEWDNPYPCIDEPTFLETQFTIQNSFWFAAGALLQQGSDIEVKSIAIRLAAIFWWFFCLIIVSSSYTANLAAFLTATSTVSIIEGVDDFKECGVGNQPDCIVDFGAKREGSTLQFFKDSKHPTFVNMMRYMETHPDSMVTDNEEGLKRVQTSNYAYLIESTTLEYYAERICNVTRVGDLIDERNYAIGMRKGYKYFQTLSEGVLHLQERGVLKKLHERWWKQKRGGGACDKGKSGDSEAERLHMDHLTGVFYLLAYGIIFAMFSEICRTIYVVRKRARENNLSFRQEIKSEFNFLLKSLANPNKPKPVRVLQRQT